MMSQTTDPKAKSDPKSTPERGAEKSARGGKSRAALRGMSYEEGLSFLSPLADFLKGAVGAPEETSLATADANAKAAVDDAQGKTPAKGAKAPADALKEVKAWTKTRMGMGDSDKQAWLADKHIRENYAKAEEAAKKGKKHPGPFEEYYANNWYKEYWRRECKDYAIGLADRINGPNATSLETLINRTDKAAKAGDAASVKGRSTAYQGCTMADITAAELASPTMQAGCVVHVKLEYQEAVPYHASPNAHHWITYVGNGRFTDSIFGENKPGEVFDKKLASWTKGEFKSNDGYRKLALIDDPKYTKVGSHPLEPVDGLQPRVSAVYDPKAAPKKG